MHCFDDAHQIAFQQRNAGAFDRDIGPRPHCNSHIGGRKRRRVVNSVARHCHDCAAGFQFFNDLDFLIGHYFRSVFIDAQLTRNRFSSSTIVAGAHDDLQTPAVKRPNRRFGRWLDGISDAKDSD